MTPTREEMYSSLAQRHGAEMQRKLSEASAAVCGLGGLGSNIAITLARAGVGHLHIIDFDTVDISNLNRQQYFPDQIGLPKTEALRDTLSRLAPYCDIRTDTVKLTPENIPELLRDDPIICEAFDSAEQKAMLVNTVLEQLPEKYLVAGSGMAGLYSANMIRTRRLGSRFYLSGDGVNGVAEGEGLFASRVMICAAHQAHMVIRLIAGETDC
ncbi:MAG TPA: sulfur carrier protein ThiS adenylyltransferase ThiF [Ruminococcus sp.]|nr:sulfur carrier protein ThiS adenylyltransferase ThiF [Ruminococcus sp.]